MRFGTSEGRSGFIPSRYSSSKCRQPRDSRAVSGDEWLDPGDEMGLWENQGNPLTVRWLTVALQQLMPSAMPDAMKLIRSTDDGAAARRGRLVRRNDRAVPRSDAPRRQGGRRQAGGRGGDRQRSPDHRISADDSRPSWLRASCLEALAINK